ncbi:MAG: hypothetical protein ABI898_04300 [Sphingomonadales bacterium]
MSTERNNLTRRSALTAGLGLAGIFALGGCQLLGLEWRYRYRLTVEVEAGGKLFTGSSVIEVTRTKGPTGIGGTSRGEAVAVDLPGGRTLFALLRGDMGGVDWPFTMPHWAFADRLGDTNMVDPAALDKLGSLRGATVILSPAQYPLLVTFRDVRDPKSVERVDPQALDNSFGPNVRLHRITVSMTDAPITTGIEKRFQWWSAYRRSHFDGTSTVSEDLTNNLLSSSLSSGSFSTEYLK